MTTALTFTHLRCECIAREPISLGRQQAGERLRNAIAAVLLQTICAEQVRGRLPTPAHAAQCPACWLLASQDDPNAVRRIYSLVPPQPVRDVVAPGERFSFTITLFGAGRNFLPYFVLILPEVGAVGVGPGRGRFELEAVWAEEPLTGAREAVVAPGERLVRAPALATSWAAAQQRATQLLAERRADRPLRLSFLTPTRLIHEEALVKQPDFGVFFRRLLHRIDSLAQQHVGDSPRDRDEVAALHALADGARLVDAQARWVECWSYSGRTERRTPMSGFVGWADYRLGDWGTLLPWLLLGQGVQVGKDTVKGNGVFTVAGAHYWQ